MASFAPVVPFNEEASSSSAGVVRWRDYIPEDIEPVPQYEPVFQPKARIQRRPAPQAEAQSHPKAESGHQPAPQAEAQPQSHRPVPQSSPQSYCRPVPPQRARSQAPEDRPYRFSGKGKGGAPTRDHSVPRGSIFEPRNAHLCQTLDEILHLCEADTMRVQTGLFIGDRQIELDQIVMATMLETARSYFQQSDSHHRRLFNRSQRRGLRAEVERARAAQDEQE